MRLQDEGLADLERGVALAPESPRHACGTRADADDLRRRVARARPRAGRSPDHDRDRGLRLHGRPRADALGRPRSHDRGELLGGLATGWLQLGDTAKATPYLDRMIAELPNTPYAKAAAARRADPTSKAPLTCLGCH